MAERCVTWRRACFSSGTAEQARIFRCPRLLSAAQQNVRVCNVCMLLRAHYAPNLQLAAESDHVTTLPRRQAAAALQQHHLGRDAISIAHQQSHRNCAHTHTELDSSFHRVSRVCVFFIKQTTHHCDHKVSSLAP